MPVEPARGEAEVALGIYKAQITRDFAANLADVF